MKISYEDLPDLVFTAEVCGVSSYCHQRNSTQDAIFLWLHHNVRSCFVHHFVLFAFCFSLTYLVSLDTLAFKEKFCQLNQSLSWKISGQTLEILFV